MFATSEAMPERPRLNLLKNAVLIYLVFEKKAAVSIMLCLLLAGATAQADLPELRFGFINELSGPVASLGAVCTRGVELALKKHAPEDRINDTPVRIVFGDAKDDVNATLSEFKRLVDIEGVQAVAAIRSKSAMPINPLAEKRGIPVLGTVGSAEFLRTNRYALRIFAPPAKQAKFEASLAERLGKKRPALVLLDDEFPVSLGQNLAAELSLLGKTAVLSETVLPQEADFAAVITKLKRADPDIIYAHLLTRTGLFVRKLRELGVRTQVVTWYWIQQPEQMAAAGNEALEGLVFTEIDSDKPRFRKAYEEAYPGEQYNAAAYLCYVTAATVLEAARLPGATRTRESLRDAIVNIAEVPLYDDTIPFRNREIQFELDARAFHQGQVAPF